MTISRISKCLAVIGILSIIAGRALADPWPDEALKFYQMPLNNGFTPYLAPPPPTYPPTPGPAYGSVPSAAFFPGHDELSTAWRTNPNTPWSGEYMADDFADYANTPVTHVRWWGSYLQEQQHSGPPVQKFLISFEHNVPASTGPTGQIIPSHPDFTHPGNLHQIVTLVPGITPPPAGTFTEKPIPTPGGAPEGLYEYNAELNFQKWFPEQAASPGTNNVYWLKIVALVDEQEVGHLQWGWHNRDWSIPDTLAAKPGDTPDGAERNLSIELGIPGPPVWHFEDDAVLGGITVSPNPTMPPFMPDVTQNGFAPQHYVPPLDGPSIIGNYSKDLAFELYTRIPEPTSMCLLAVGLIGGMGVIRRHR